MSVFPGVETQLDAPILDEPVPDAPRSGREGGGSGNRWLVLALFFLSGACGLIYEVVWMRMLTLVFGATAFATSTILASFFAGLALGSFVFGRIADRQRRPLRTYALLEAGVALFAFLMPALFAAITWIYVSAAQHLPLGYYAINGVRFALAFAVLVVPAALLGGTLPIVVRFFVARSERIGWNVGILYGVNTFGAVVGTVAAGFFLILALGVRETAYLAGAVNLLVAVAAWIVDRRLEAKEAVGEPAPAPGEGGEAGGGEAAAGGGEAGARVAEPSDVYSPAAARLALWAVGISGFCALALEVFWTRALVFFLDISTHAFTTILTAFLLGIGLGSLLIARFVDARRRPLTWLGWIEILIGVSAVLAIPVLDRSTHVLERLAGSSLDDAFAWKWMGMRFVNTLAVMLVPTVLLGTTIPLVTRIHAAHAGVVGSALGRVYSVNTIGGVLGSVAAGFVLIPWIGVQHGILLVSGITVLLGGVLATSDPRSGGSARGLAAFTAGVMLFVGGGAFLSSDARVLTSYYEGRESVEVLSYEEKIGATVKVFEDAFGERQISVDGFPVAGTPVLLQDIQKALGHLPLLLTDVPEPRVNIVGFGAGGTSWAVTLYDPSRVDCVELVPAVPAAAGWFDEVNHGVLGHPDFTLVREDGRNYALVTDRTYDVITIDATSPKMAGNGSLYALEFYRLMAERLSPEGMLVQWIPLHLLSPAEMRMTARTFTQVFPHTTFWLTPLRQYGVLVGTHRALEIDVEALQAKLERPGVREELASLNVTSALDVLSTFVMGEEGVARYVEGARINSDNHPYLEFTPAMSYFVGLRYQVRNTRDLLERRESVVPLLRDPGGSQEEAGAFLERVARRHEATEHSLTGDILILMGMRDDAIAAYRRAQAIDPGDKGLLNPIWWEQRPEG